MRREHLNCGGLIRPSRRQTDRGGPVKFFKATSQPIFVRKPCQKPYVSYAFCLLSICKRTMLNQEDIMDGKKTVKETMKEADPELQILAFKRFTLRSE